MMCDDRQKCAEQILQAIHHGKLPKAEIEQRLWKIIDDTLSGPEQTETDCIRAELCNSLLWELYSQGEVSGLRFSASGSEKEDAGVPSLNARLSAIKERGIASFQTRKRRRNAVRGITVMAAVLVLVISLIGMNVILSPWRKTTESQAPETHSAGIQLDLVSHAIAEHMESGQHQIITSDSAEYVEFLGFDPDIPERLCDTYTVTNYQAMVEPSSITLSIPYRTESASSLSGIEQFNLSITMLGSTEESNDYADLAEEGHLIDVQGVPVYECSDPGRGYYIWNGNQAIYMLVMRESITEKEDVLKAIIAKTIN